MAFRAPACARWRSEWRPRSPRRPGTSRVASSRWSWNAAATTGCRRTTPSSARSRRIPIIPMSPTFRPIGRAGPGSQPRPSASGSRNSLRSSGARSAPGAMRPCIIASGAERRPSRSSCPMTCRRAIRCAPPGSPRGAIRCAASRRRQRPERHGVAASTAARRRRTILRQATVVCRLVAETGRAGRETARRHHQGSIAAPALRRPHRRGSATRMTSLGGRQAAA
jgi:hypothetical protein